MADTIAPTGTIADDLLEQAWGIICNSNAAPETGIASDARDAARRFRGSYHDYLATKSDPDASDSQPEVSAISAFQQQVHAQAVTSGWWEGKDIASMTQTEIIEAATIKLALVHSEVSEALEELRSNRIAGWVGENGKPEGFTVELGDAVIRIMDVCGWLGEDLGVAMEVKAQYNATRSYRHGGRAV